MTGEATLCCPDEDRRTDLVTACGLPVADVHRHRGMLRGFGCEGESKRLLFWLRNGRLTNSAELDYDLRRAG